MQVYAVLAQTCEGISDDACNGEYEFVIVEQP